MSEYARLCTPEMPVALNALELTSIIALSSLAKSLRKVVGNPARMQRASMGSWARKRARRRTLGSALRDFMRQKRMKGFVSLRHNKDRSPMSLEALIMPKALVRVAFNASYLPSVGEQDDSVNFSCYDVVQDCNNMIELSQVYCEGWGMGC